MHGTDDLKKLNLHSIPNNFFLGDCMFILLRGNTQNYRIESIEVRNCYSFCEFMARNICTYE